MISTLTKSVVVSKGDHFDGYEAKGGEQRVIMPSREGLIFVKLSRFLTGKFQTTIVPGCLMSPGNGRVNLRGSGTAFSWGQREKGGSGQNVNRIHRIHPKSILLLSIAHSLSSFYRLLDLVKSIARV